MKATVERDPNNFDALAQLGGMHMDAAKYGQAIDYFERALRVRSDANLRADLAICYKQNGRPDRAAKRLEFVSPFWSAYFFGNVEFGPSTAALSYREISQLANRAAADAMVAGRVTRLGAEYSRLIQK